MVAGQSFEKYRFFKPDATRAYCRVEAILLDVRTGLVPFTATSTQVYDAVKTDREVNTSEAVLRARLWAVSEGMGKIAELTVAFLESGDATDG